MRGLSPSFRVSDTLSGDLVEFTAPRELKVYVCGLTVYDYAHIGHARTVLVFDVLYRMAEAKGFSMRYVQNFTDVDDKIIARAAQAGVEPSQLAQRFMEEALVDFDSLNVRRPTLMPRATQHIDGMQRIIGGLLEGGFAYAVPTGVYFDVSKFPGYGKLSKKRVDQLLAGARVEPDPNKRSPADFALWKVYSSGPLWPSPWGAGRPGWHIECSAMIKEHLGDTIDIHGGGADLIFPHHENEIAQSECYNGAPLSRAWMHVGLLSLRSEKMAKSVGNVIRMRDAVELWGPNTLRTYLLSSHYRGQLDFSLDGLRKAYENWRLVESAAYGLREDPPRGDPEGEMEGEASGPLAEFDGALSSDLDTPKAIASLVRLSRSVGKLAAASQLGSASRDIADAFWLMFDVLGYRLPAPSPEESAEVSRLLGERERLRSAGRFGDADMVRERLRSMGYEVVDSPGGAVSARKVERPRFALGQAP